MIMKTRLALLITSMSLFFGCARQPKFEIAENSESIPSILLPFRDEKCLSSLRWAGLAGRRPAYVLKGKMSGSCLRHILDEYNGIPIEQPLELIKKCNSLGYDRALADLGEGHYEGFEIQYYNAYFEFVRNRNEESFIAIVRPSEVNPQTK